MRRGEGEGDGIEDAARTRRLLAEAQALAHLGIWEWDIASDELYWSDELFQILGLAPRELPASFEALLARVHADDLAAVKSHLARARRDRCPLSIEYRIVRPAGEVRTLQGRVRAMLDDDGALLRLVGTAQDITDTKELAARLVFSDRMVSVGTLAGGVAHEINNPLAVIAANLDLIVERPELPDEALAIEARVAVERIRTIVRGLSAFSRADDDHRAPLDVERVLELAIGMAGHEIRHRARLVKQYAATPQVHANEARLGHAFLNLLVNAAEAIPDGHADRNEIRVATRTDAAGWIAIEIRDTGAGIPRDIQGRVFDPFFTTKRVGAGTGLGLSICLGIVRSLGGEITLRSEPGKGSVFRISLPPASEATAGANGVARKRQSSEFPLVAPERRGHILIVDDELVFASSLRRLLLHEHAVSIVGSGREALERLRAGDRFDAILCDLMMPEMTGADLHVALADLAPDQAERMIFVTGGAFSPTSQQFLERVPNLCFEKPCDLPELRAAIRRWVAVVRP